MMCLPFDLICRYLSKKWTIRKYPESGKYPDVSEPFLYTDEMPLHNASTVIADATRLPEEPFIENVGCLISCGGMPSSKYLCSGLAIISVETTRDIYQVFNCIQECFYYYKEWIEKLDGLRKKNASLQDVINAGSHLLGNRVEITDAGHVFVAASQKGKYSDKASRPEKYNYSTITPERFSEYKKKYAGLRRLKKAFVWSEESPAEGIQTFPTLCANLFDGSAFIGAVTVQPTEKEFEPGDLRILEMLVPYVQEAILRAEEERSDKHIILLRDVLHGIIMGHDPDLKMLSHLSAMTHFSPECDIRCIAVRLPDDTKRLEFGKYLKKQMLSIYPDSVVFIYNKYLIIIVRTPESMVDSLSVETLVEILSGVYTYAGISDPFRDLAMSRYYFHEAEFALETAIQTADKSHIVFFSDCKENFIFKHCVGDLPPDLLFPAGLLRVLEHDKTSQVSYVETLRVYLDSDRNVAKAAKALFISRNALLTRLEKIDNILELDLENAENRFLLNLCLRLI